MQGGQGEYCLCQNCNSFLGNNYVPSYYTMASVGRYILQTEKDATRIHFYVPNLSPLRLLKQVISMFICINQPDFTDAYAELLAFVKNPREQYLPEKYKVYMYFKRSEGITRYLSMMYTNTHGLLCEVAFPPLGFVLSIDNPNPIPLLANITQFKNVDFDYNDKVILKLNVLPTHLPFVADYRTQEEIDETVRQSNEYLANEENQES